MLSSFQIRSRFIEFFKKRNHAFLPSASLVPENDPSVLFNTAGMQPLVPYLMGQKHPLGTRLVSAQKCVRTGDIEEVGNHKNLTFFEMLGNWSLGDYFKEDAIAWSYEFLTSTEEGLGLDPARLYVTVFEGDADAPRDLEAVEIWKKYIPEHRIYFLPKKNNWWSPGENGPCGPDTEMFYDVTESGLGDLTHDEYVAADNDGRVVEIWNDVFMEYEKQDGNVVGKLAQKNVDTGSGLERITMIVQGKNNVYECDLFQNASKILEGDKFISNNPDLILKSKRIVLDHFRTALFLAADGVIPANKDRGYIMRRLIRRALVHWRKIRFPYMEAYVQILDAYVSSYENTYPEVGLIKQGGYKVILDEINKFQKTLDNAYKIVEKQTLKMYLNGNGGKIIESKDYLDLITTHGMPREILNEILADKKIGYLEYEINDLMAEHQAKSRAGAEQKFKGGLANTNETTVRLHTAHHLLLAALQEVLGKEVKQKGSNITEERLRIDFNFDRKVTPEEIQKIEILVNGWITEKLPVVRREMRREDAEQLGAEMEFGAKYPDMVSVYTIQKPNDSYVSKEFCGGPHVTNTADIGTFKIQKEEASSAGIRRIKAVIG